jgi:hypothetical protein
MMRKLRLSLTLIAIAASIVAATVIFTTVGSAAALGGASTVRALPNLAGAQDTPQQTDTPAITLQDIPFSSGAKLTIERRGQIVLFGINRPYIQNRIDPGGFRKTGRSILPI